MLSFSHHALMRLTKGTPGDLGRNDLVIGQNNTPGEDRVRTAKLLLDTAKDPIEIKTSKDWVIPTGEDISLRHLSKH